MIGSATSVFALIVNTATSRAASRMRPTIASSLSDKTGASEEDFNSNETPVALEPARVRECLSATIALPSCIPPKRLSGVKRHASSRPVGVR